MNKTQQINNQRKIIENLSDDLARLRLRLDAEAKLVTDLVDQCDQADARTTALRDKHAAEKKAATEAATLKSIANGLVPIEVLRNHIREEYKTTHNASLVKTDLTVMLDCARPVDKAILAALTEKPITYNFANGGFRSPSPFSPFQPGDKVSILKPSVDPGSIWLVRGAA